MIRYVFLFISLLALVSCGEDKTIEINIVDVEPNPLNAFNEKEDYLIIQLFPNIGAACKKTEEKEHCLANLEVSVETAKKYGYQVTQKQFLSKAYIDNYRSVLKKQKDYLRSLDALGKPMPEKLKIYKAKEQHLLEAQRRLSVFTKGKISE